MPADLLAELDLDAARAAVAAAGSVDELDELRKRLVGKGSVAARVKQSIKDLPGRPEAGRRARRSPSSRRRSTRGDRRARRAELAPAGDATEPPLDLTLGRPRPARGVTSTSSPSAERELEDVFVSLGLPGGRRARGRGRLAQLRGAELPARAPGTRDAGHALRGPRRARAGAAAHAHVAGADPGDGDAAAADLLDHARAGRTATRRSTPATRRCSTRSRGSRSTAASRSATSPGTLEAFTSAYFGKKREVAPAPVVLPVHRAVGRVRDQLRVLRRRRVPGLLEDGMDRARRLRHGRPERVPQTSASTPRSTRGSRSASGSSACRCSGTASSRSRRSSTTTSASSPSTEDPPCAPRCPGSVTSRRSRRIPRDRGGARPPRARGRGDRGTRARDHRREGRRRHPRGAPAPERRQAAASSTSTSVGHDHGRVRRAERRRRHGRAVRAVGCDAARRVHARAPEDPRRSSRDGMLLLAAGARARRRPRRDPRRSTPTTELGADVRDVLGLDDVVFDLSITPNRPDAMSIVGVARDLAAHFGLPFTVPEPVDRRSRRADRIRDHASSSRRRTAARASRRAAST